MCHLNFEVTGPLSAGDECEPIVFLHGLLMNRRVFKPQIQNLSLAHPCVAVDFPGHGRSSPPPATADYAMDRLAEMVGELLADLYAPGGPLVGYGPCTLVGHSMGGFAAMRVAIRRSQYIGKMVLICTSAGAEPEAAKLRFLKLIKIVRVVGRWLFLLPVPGFDVLMKTMFGRTFLQDRSRRSERRQWRQILGQVRQQPGIDAALAVCNRAGIPDAELGKITMPVLIVGGEEDKTRVPSELARLSRCIVNATLLPLIPKAGHTPMIEQPDAVTDAISAFVNSRVG